MPALTITVYGGWAGADASSGEIGGNKILLEYEGRAWFLDFGTRFGQIGRYFDEFLNPRSAVGLRDFLRMGLIPPIEGIYRSDLTLHEPNLWDRYRKHPGYRKLEHLDGILLSHAHQDHNGCLGFIRCDVPVYTGLMTALIGKGMQDISGGSADAQYSYQGVYDVCDLGTLRARTGVKVGRPHFICESDEAILKALEPVTSFLNWHPGKKTQLTPAPVKLADTQRLGIRFFRVDHSIPGSGAFALATPIGWIAYTGDLRLHGHSRWRTEQFAKEVAALKPRLLVVEGTSLSDKKATEEPAVQGAAEEVVQQEPGLVIADFSPRNIERLRSFRDIALKTGRKLVITVKDAYLLRQMHVIDEKIPQPGEDPIAILEAPRATRNSWEDELFETFRSSVVSAGDIRKRPGGYILCLSFWDITNLIDLEPEGGTYIYSSSEAHDEEQQFDQKRLTNWLNHFGMKSVGGLPGSEKGSFHASGHMDGPGMEWLIETINPERMLPVHTQKLGWFEQRWPEKVISTRYGEPLVFD